MAETAFSDDDADEGGAEEGGNGDEFFVPEFEHDQKSGAAAAAAAETAALQAAVRETRDLSAPAGGGGGNGGGWADTGDNDSLGEMVGMAGIAETNMDDPSSPPLSDAEGDDRVPSPVTMRRNRPEGASSPSPSTHSNRLSLEIQETSLDIATENADMADMAAGMSSAFGASNDSDEETHHASYLTKQVSDGRIKGEMTFEQFATAFFSDTSEDNYSHSKNQLTAPLLKQVWGDGDSHRVLVTWSALLFFLGDTKHKGEYTININEDAVTKKKKGLGHVNIGIEFSPDAGADTFTMKVRVNEGKGLTAQDLNGFSDPFVKLYVGDIKKKTNVEKKTLSPQWNETLVFEGE